MNDTALVNCLTTGSISLLKFSLFIIFDELWISLFKNQIVIFWFIFSFSLIDFVTVLLSKFCKESYKDPFILKKEVYLLVIENHLFNLFSLFQSLNSLSYLLKFRYLFYIISNTSPVPMVSSKIHMFSLKSEIGNVSTSKMLQIFIHILIHLDS